MNLLWKKRVKNLQKAFNSSSSILRILQDNDSTVDLNYKMSIIFSYYLCKFDKKTNYTFDELMNNYNKLIDEAYKNGKDIIEQRYYFQAFNGFYENTFKKNGLDDISDIEPKVKNAFELLEEELGRTTYGALAGKSNNQICSFLTTDPYMAIRYALSYSPERLWFGPLNSGFIDSRPPIKIGESKIDYMMRIIESKIKERDIKDINKVLEAGKIVCEEFGSKRPRIAIVPEEGIKDYFANYSGTRTEYDKTVKELAQEENNLWTLNLSSGPNLGNEYGLAVFGKITRDKFKTIIIPDAFELTQMYAIERGANIGDFVDASTGEIVSTNKENKLVTVKKNDGLLQKTINKIRQIIKMQFKEKENKTNGEILKKYKNLGLINLGGTGKMYLYKDENEQKYLFKPSIRKNTDIYEPYRAEAQVIASKLQQMVSTDTAVKCETIEFDGVKGTIQPKIQCDKEKMAEIEEYYFGDRLLDEKLYRQFMREYVVDYLLGNYDSHYRNFIVDENGNLRGIDKEQSLKHIGDQEIQGDLKFNQFNPNAVYGEYPPIYEKIFRDIDDGKISSDILEETINAINKVKKIPRQEYIKLFEPYVDAIIKSYPEKDKNHLYECILNRYDSLEDIKNMINDYNQKPSLTELSSIAKGLKKKYIQLTQKVRGEKSSEKGDSKNK